MTEMAILVRFVSLHWLQGLPGCLQVLERLAE